MAKTLIIKNANFATNKLDTVSFETIPCTGISLAEQSASVEYLDTYTAVATVTPADTTDEIVRTSNNEHFTVVDGIVTIGGVGEAVITATCGSFSASVTLTATATLDIDDFDLASGMYLSYETSGSSHYCALTERASDFSIGRISSDGYHTLWTNQATKDVGETFCPAIIPAGSTSMTITCASEYHSLCMFANRETQSAIGYGAVEIVGSDAGYIQQETRTLTIPSGADGYYVSFYNTSSFEIVFS